MNQTLRKQTFRSAPSLHPHAWNGRVTLPGSQSDPADLAEALRVLAVRARDALKLAQKPLNESTRVELINVRTAIGWLENEFQNQQMDRMLPYVVSLRQQVESVLV